MKYLLLLFLLPLSLNAAEKTHLDYEQIFNAYDDGGGCANGSSPDVMYACSEKKILLLNDSITSLFDKLVKSSSEESSDLAEKHQVVQTNWFISHELECEIENHDSITGTGYGLIMNFCIIRKMNQRLNYLQWLANQV